MTDLKVKPAIAAVRQTAQAIRVYAGKIMKEIDSTVESSEAPELLVKKEFSKRRKVAQYSLVLIGPYHVEEIRYAKKDPATWSTFGELCFTRAQFAELPDNIRRILRSREREPAQALLKLEHMVVRVRRGTWRCAAKARLRRRGRG